MTQGFTELEDKLANLLSQSRRKQKETLNEMADIMYSELPTDIPIDKGNLEGTANGAVRKPRMVAGELQMKIGLTGTPSSFPDFYAHFVDTGTIYQRPQNFSEKARDNAKPQLMDTIKKAYRINNVL